MDEPSEVERSVCIREGNERDGWGWYGTAIGYKV